MKIEVHILQNFAPSCLNRDDTNTPKSCEFGGATRARVSSQSWKRATRKSEMFASCLTDGKMAVRTRDIAGEIAKRISGQPKAPETTEKIVVNVFKEAGLIPKKEPKPQAEGGDDEDGSNNDESAISNVLVFMAEESINKMVESFKESWESLKKGDKQTKSSLIEQLANILVESVRVPEIALYGRMLQPAKKTPFAKINFGVDAACQVAHAISTHKVNLETDFYTAVDDLVEGRDEIGAGMLGTQGYNSACYYRYAVLDREQLLKNLGGDTNLTNTTIKAFLRAFTLSIPGAKQNSHAAQNPPSLVLFAARETGTPVSLANAFARPVYGTDLIGQSKHQLSRYFTNLDRIYKLYEEATLALIHDSEDEKILGERLQKAEKESLDSAISAIMKKVSL